MTDRTTPPCPFCEQIGVKCPFCEDEDRAVGRQCARRETPRAGGGPDGAPQDRAARAFNVQPLFEEGGGIDDWGLYPGTAERVEAEDREAAIATYIANHGGVITGVLDWKIKEL